MTAGSASIENRRTARSRIRVRARYVSDSLIIDGVVTDVSPEGVFFCSDYLDGQGEIVQVSLDIPWRPEPLELRGEVRWVSETPRTGGMGIRFFGVSFEDRVVLSSLGVADMADAAHAGEA